MEPLWPEGRFIPEYQLLGGGEATTLVPCWYGFLEHLADQCVIQDAGPCLVGSSRTLLTFWHNVLDANDSLKYQGILSVLARPSAWMLCSPLRAKNVVTPTHLLYDFIFGAIGEKKADLTPQILADLENRETFRSLEQINGPPLDRHRVTRGSPHLV